ncbi:hypothetical protein EDD86DRAFT_246840 [Gorgonomyces haynaldii]|nr:hypothetical protein EDD86DRAFT_246840 [Gorgonomyces haynaldii]
MVGLEALGVLSCLVVLYSVSLALWTGSKRVILISAFLVTCVSLVNYLPNISRLDLILSNWDTGYLFFDRLNGNASQGTPLLQSILAHLNMANYMNMFCGGLFQSIYVLVMLDNSRFIRFRSFCLSHPKLFFSLSLLPGLLLALSHWIERRNSRLFDIAGQLSFGCFDSFTVHLEIILSLLIIPVVFLIGRQSQHVLSRYDNSKPFNKSDINFYFANQVIHYAQRMPIAAILLVTDRLIWWFPSSFNVYWTYFYCFLRLVNAWQVFQSNQGIPEVSEHMPSCLRPKQTEQPVEKVVVQPVISEVTKTEQMQTAKL